jgi:MFS family permease
MRAAKASANGRSRDARACGADSGRMHSHSRAPLPSPWLLVTAAGLVLGLAMGVRQVQGLFMLPMLTSTGWSREVFSFAFGLQVLVWGIVQPLAGMLADRFGTRWVIAAGCLLYAAGLGVQAFATTPALLVTGAGAMIGIALTATTFSTVYAGLARLFPPQRRGWAQGMAGAIAGFIQFVLVPLSQAGIATIGWSETLVGFAVAALVCIAAAVVIDDRAAPAASNAGTQIALLPAMRQALSHSGFWLLNLGFVSCGFQLAFLGVHLPAYLRDGGLPAGVAVNALAIIALANAVGTYVCGRLGDLYRRKYLLAIVYTIRTAAMVAFVALPLSPASVYVFALVMGSTWLGTVPLTSGVVAQIFGVRYLSTLFGLVFLGHQLGGFFGAWLGGLLYDSTHSYSMMWAIAVALGVASVVFNLPIRDASVEGRQRLAAA